MRLSSYGCTWEVWRALKKQESTPRATLTLLSCSPNFPRASITRYMHAKHGPILNSRAWRAQTAKPQTSSVPRGFTSFFFFKRLCLHIYYFFRFSGITSKMLENVTTTLADVQKRLIDLLPPDAILLGHSLENDLRALKVGYIKGALFRLFTVPYFLCDR